MLSCCHGRAGRRLVASWPGSFGVGSSARVLLFLSYYSRPSKAQAAELEQLEAKRLDLREHAVQCCLVGEGAPQDRVLAADLRFQGRERPEDRVPQVPPEAELAVGRLGAAPHRPHLPTQARC